MRKSLKGFTLVELLAAMAIIAILIGLAGFGISLALRGSRNSQRRKALDNVQLVINDYYTQETTYPASIAVSGTNLVMQDALGNAVGEPVPVEDHLGAAATTSSSATQYRYGIVATGYLLCVEVEGGDWFDLSSGTGDCPTTGTVVN